MDELPGTAKPSGAISEPTAHARAERRRPAPRGLRWAYLGLGHMTLGLGVLGIVVPLLPTTPFLLLTAGLYARGSPGFHAWLLDHPRLGPYIHQWRTQRTVPLRAKVLGLLLVWTGAVATWFLAPLAAIRWTMVAVAVVVSFVIARLRTTPRAHATSGQHPPQTQETP